MIDDHPYMRMDLHDDPNLIHPKGEKWDASSKNIFTTNFLKVLQFFCVFLCFRV